MKVRNLQFEERKNPDSSRVHGLRLAVRSLPVESVRKSESTNGAELALPPTPYDARRSELPHNGLQNEAAGGAETGRGRLLTVEDVAVLLHVPVSWVYGRTRKRSLERLPGYRLGKYWRFREGDITAWLESQNPRARSL
jgi:excisionase family DNA binding protein